MSSLKAISQYYTSLIEDYTESFLQSKNPFVNENRLELSNEAESALRDLKRWNSGSYEEKKIIAKAIILSDTMKFYASSVTYPNFYSFIPLCFFRYVFQRAVVEGNLNYDFLIHHYRNFKETNIWQQVIQSVERNAVIKMDTESQKNEDYDELEYRIFTKDILISSLLYFINLVVGDYFDYLFLYSRIEQDYDILFFLDDTYKFVTENEITIEQIRYSLVEKKFLDDKYTFFFASDENKLTKGLRYLSISPLAPIIYTKKMSFIREIYLNTDMVLGIVEAPKSVWQSFVKTLFLSICAWLEFAQRVRYLFPVNSYISEKGLRLPKFGSDFWIAFTTKSSFQLFRKKFSQTIKNCSVRRSAMQRLGY